MKKYDIIINPKFTEIYSIDANSRHEALSKAFKLFSKKKKVKKDYKVKVLFDPPRS